MYLQILVTVLLPLFQQRFCFVMKVLSSFAGLCSRFFGIKKKKKVQKRYILFCKLMYGRYSLKLLCACIYFVCIFALILKTFPLLFLLDYYLLSYSHQIKQVHQKFCSI